MRLSDIQKDISTSLKSGDKVRVNTLRFLLSAVRNLAIAKYGAEGEAKLTEEDILDVIKKQVKTHKESIEAFGKAGRTELADKEKAELAVLEAFLPKEISDEDLKKILEPIAKSGETNLPAGRQDFGLLMKQAMAAVGGQADGGRVSAALKQILQTK